MRIAVPDLISPSYFPAIAAVDLGLARDEGLDVELELLYPVTDAAEALRTGEIDFLASAAHAPMHAFPHWRGAKLVVALSRNMYWFLVMRADLGIARGDLGALKGCGSAPLPAPTSACGACSPPRASTPNATASASAPSRPPTAPAPRSASPRHRRCGTGWSTGSGPTAWAPRSPSARAAARSSSTPGAATAPGRGRLHVPALAVTDGTIARRPDAVGAMVRAVVRAQAVLRADPGRAAEVGGRLFPPEEAS